MLGPPLAHRDAPEDEIMASVIDILPVTLALLLLAGAAVFDLGYRMLPNWLPALLAIDGTGVRLVSGSLAAGLIAGLGVFAACVVLWRWGVMGGGDVKLLGAVALAIPATAGLIVWTALAGGVLAACYLLLRRVVPKPGRARPRRLLSRLARVEQRRIHRGRSLPYCCAIAMGAVFTLAGY